MYMCIIVQWYTKGVVQKALIQSGPSLCTTVYCKRGVSELFRSEIPT